jgi:hypothetical protein
MVRVDEFIPEDELLDKVYQEGQVQWHSLKECPYCGDRMFWDDNWHVWLCRSWIYMEGGCPW